MNNIVGSQKYTPVTQSKPVEESKSIKELTSAILEGANIHDTLSSMVTGITENRMFDDFADAVEGYLRDFYGSKYSSIEPFLDNIISYAIEQGLTNKDFEDQTSNIKKILKAAVLHFVK